MLNETVEGGAYQSPDGRWINANGEPLKAADAKRAEQLAAENQEEMDAADVRLMESEAMRDPVARALSALLRQQSAPPAETKKD